MVHKILISCVEHFITDNPAPSNLCRRKGESFVVNIGGASVVKKNG